MSTNRTAYAILGTRLVPHRRTVITETRGCDHPLLPFGLSIAVNFCPQCGKRMHIRKKETHEDEFLSELYDAWNEGKSQLPENWIVIGPSEYFAGYIIGFGVDVKEWKDKNFSKSIAIPSIGLIQEVLTTVIPEPYKPLQNFGLWAILDIA